jgi:hypothetical protein
MSCEKVEKIYVIENKIVSRLSVGRVMGKKGELKNEAYIL